MAKQLYVTNISFKATEEDLFKLFSVAGKVKHIKLLSDPVTGRSKGCGFVEMATAKEVKEAIHTLDDCLLIDRQISVEEARPMAPREKDSIPRGRPGQNKNRRPPTGKR